MLCPFSIQGDGCPSLEEAGYVIPSGRDLYIMCEPYYYAAGSTGCIIDCPGTHFRIEEHGSLTLDSITLRGSNSSAIKVESNASLTAFNSYFELNENAVSSGGAIFADEGADVYLSQTVFVDNTAPSGGAIHSLGNSQIHNSHFLGNEATSHAVDMGGGALYMGMSSTAYITGSTFHNNAAVSFGPAILDRTDGGNYSVQGNTGCNNIAQSLGMACDGALQVFEGIDVCSPFEQICGLVEEELDPGDATLTSAPSTQPTIMDSQAPTAAPTALPTWAPNRLTLEPSTEPSYHPSESQTTYSPTQASESPTEPPSGLPTRRPVVVGKLESETSESRASEPPTHPSQAPASISPTANENFAIGAFFVLDPAAVPTIETKPDAAIPTSLPTARPSPAAPDRPAFSPMAAPSIPPTATPSESALSPSKGPSPSPSESASVPSVLLKPTQLATVSEPLLDIDPTLMPSLAEDESSTFWPGEDAGSWTTEPMKGKPHQDLNYEDTGTPEPTHASTTTGSPTLLTTGQPSNKMPIVPEVAVAPTSLSAPTFVLELAPIDVIELAPGENEAIDDQLVELAVTDCTHLNKIEELSPKGFYQQGYLDHAPFDMIGLQSCGSSVNIANRGRLYRVVGEGAVMTAHTCSVFFQSFSFDAQLTIYTSDKVGDNLCIQDLICVGANDDYCGKQSLVNWFAEKGQVYFIFVQGKSLNIANSPAMHQPFALTLTPTPGGSCNSAIALEVSPLTGKLELPVGGDPAGMDVMASIGYVWFEVAGTDFSWLVASACQEDGTFPARLQVFQGSCENFGHQEVNIIESVCVSGQILTWLTTPGQRYFIKAYNL